MQLTSRRLLYSCVDPITTSALARASRAERCRLRFCSALMTRMSVQPRSLKTGTTRRSAARYAAWVRGRAVIGETRLGSAKQDEMEALGGGNRTAPILLSFS